MKQLWSSGSDENGSKFCSQACKGKIPSPHNEKSEEGAGTVLVWWQIWNALRGERKSGEMGRGYNSPPHRVSHFLPCVPPEKSCVTMVMTFFGIISLFCDCFPTSALTARFLEKIWALQFLVSCLLWRRHPASPSRSCHQIDMRPPFFWLWTWPVFITKKWKM